MMIKLNYLKLILMLIILIIPQVIFSQPFYYYSGKKINSGSERIYYHEIRRLNLFTRQDEFFLTEEESPVCTDPTQQWLVCGDGVEGSRLYNTQDTSKVFYFEDNIEQVLYSDSTNTIYLIGPTRNGGGITRTLWAVNINTGNEIFSTPLPYYIYPNEEAFFSSDKKRIYIPVSDTTQTTEAKFSGIVLCFSTVSNTIIDSVRVSSIANKDASGYAVQAIREGKGILESIIGNDAHDTFYKVYDFENTSSSNYIFNSGYASSYPLCNGKYILLSEETIDTVNGTAWPNISTGKIKIYDVASTQLLRTLFIQPNTKLMTFDQYPNMIYSVSKEDSLFSFTKINIDSVINHLGLQMISPAITFPNSGSFTIEVTGKGFSTASKVLWNDSVRTTTFVSDSLLRVSILAADVATVGNKIVRVKYDSTSSAVSDSMVFSVVTTLPKPVRLVIEKEIDNHNGTMTAWFGYLNVNDRSVYIPVGDKNSFSPTPIDRGQATIFLPGRHKYVFGVTFPSTINIEWQLNGRRAKAGSVCEN
jgi:hypothetical protein